MNASSIVSNRRNTFLRFTNLLFLLLLFACTTDTQESSTSSSTIEYTYSSNLYKETDCRSNCAEVEVNLAKSNSVAVNKYIESIVKASISNYLRSDNGLITVEDYSNEFNNGFKAFKEAFPDTSTPWQLSIDQDITFASEKLICLKQSEYSYTGGAHANEVVAFFFVDDKGKPVNAKNLITDQKTFEQIAEERFRKSNGIAQDQSWEKTDFMFDDNTFSLPEAIGLSRKGAILYYNNYEIGPYAAGPTEVLLPMESIQETLNKNYID